MANPLFMIGDVKGDTVPIYVYADEDAVIVDGTSAHAETSTNSGDSPLVYEAVALSNVRYRVGVGAEADTGDRSWGAYTEKMIVIPIGEELSVLGGIVELQRLRNSGE